MRSSQNKAADPSSPVDGLSLLGYVEICRALIRTAGDSTRRIEQVLAAHDMSPEQWERVRQAWSERIRLDPRVRSEFQRLYVRAGDAGGTNE